MRTTKRIRIAGDSFDIVDASGATGIRLSDQLSHIGVEFRRYKDGEKKCDRREGFMTAFPKDLLPAVIDNLARLTLADSTPSPVQLLTVPMDAQSRISTWRMRIQNARDRAEFLSLLRLMVEAGSDDDIKALMGPLGRFVQKYEASNPHLADKYLAISDEMFPDVTLTAQAEFLRNAEPQGSA